MMSTSFNSLPLELLDAIFAPLSSDISSLKACSLACRSCVAPAQKSLFSELSIGRDVGEDGLQADLKMCRSLLDTLENSSHFALYFRHIIIRVDHPDDHDFPKIARLLSQILSESTNVHALTLESTSKARLRYELLQPHLKDAILEVMERPVFKSLTMHNWTFADDASNLAKLIHYARNSIEYLSLFDLHFTASSDQWDDYDTIDDPIELPNLLEYHINCVPMLTQVELFVFPKLQKIKWPMHWNGAGAEKTCIGTRALARVLSNPSCWSLFIGSQWYDDSPQCHALTPDRFSSLTHLELSVEARDSNRFAIDTLQHIKELVPSPAVIADSPLQSITVIFLLKGKPCHIWPISSWEEFINTALKPLLDQCIPHQLSLRDTHPHAYPQKSKCSLAFAFKIRMPMDAATMLMLYPPVEIFLRKNGNDSDEDEDDNDILARVERVQEMLRDRLSENMGDPGRISFDVHYRENLWIW